ncbi:MAG TPA: hypothetical protein VNN73_02130 [Blastocatellia bacterium]|nr:hypothetical protein [Blastocatellia bacterium]
MEHEREVRLRRRIEEIVRSRVSLLEQDISRLQREVNESFTRLLEQTDAAATVTESDEAIGQIEAEVNAQIDQASAASVRLGADIALLRDSVTELNEQRTQAEVLNALIARAANFAPRVVLFVVKGPNALAWAARGIEETGGNIRGLSISLQSDTALRAATGANQTFYGSPDEHAENQLIFSHIGNLQPQRVLAVPLKVRGKTAAIVYADSADHGENAINVEAIELLVNTSGLVVELVSLRTRVSESAKPAATQPSPTQAAQQPSEPAAPTSGALPHVQTAPSGELHPQPAASTAAHQAAPPAPTFFKPATEPPTTVEPAVSAPPPVHQTQESWSAVSSRTAALDEEEKLHNDARRFARLLVSEIKLYNEQKVAEGRRNGDLYDRLKEDIDRSRQMYEKRVTPQVAAKFDYFYDELVNTLAEGDPSKLGSDYPGPSVAV